MHSSEESYGLASIFHTCKQAPCIPIVLKGWVPFGAGGYYYIALGNEAWCL